MKKIYLKPETDVTSMQPVTLLDGSVFGDGSGSQHIGDGGKSDGWGDAKGRTISGGHIGHGTSAWD